MSTDEERTQELARIQGDAKLVGVGEALASAVLECILSEVPGFRGVHSAIQSYRSKRDVDIQTNIVSALESGEFELTPEILESDTFIHGVFTIVRAASRTTVQKKQRIFALLLSGTLADSAEGDMDEFEELVRITEGLSLLEMKILLRVARSTNTTKDGIPGFSLNRHDGTLRLPSVEDEFGLNTHEMHGMLNRLQGAGLLRSRLTGAQSHQFTYWETSGLYDRWSKTISGLEEEVLQDEPRL